MSVPITVDADVGTVAMSVKLDWEAPRTRRRSRAVPPAPSHRDALASSIEAGDAALDAITESVAKAMASTAAGIARDPTAAITLRHARSRGVRTQWAIVLRHWARVRQTEDVLPGIPWHASPEDRRFEEDSRGLLVPLADVNALELVADLASDNGSGIELAARLESAWVDELQAELALFATGQDPERDLLAVRELVAAPRSLDLSWLLAAAIAFRYGQRCRGNGGILVSAASTPMTLANACLALVLWRLRVYPTIVPQLLSSTSIAADNAGAWLGDDGEMDLLTTIVAAEVLSTLDPDFDPWPTTAALLRRQRPSGTWHDDRVPDVWLTREVVAWLRSVSRPFSERFRWPGVTLLDRDRRTGLPTPGYFVDLERAVTQVAGLRGSTMDLAFVDLAGFGKFNNGFGQAKGDEVIAAFGRALDRVELTQTVRDGGDEFVVMGPPGRRGLTERMSKFGRDWAAEFRDRFGTNVDAVAPRIVVAEGQPASGLAAVRERLGRSIAEAKRAAVDVPPTGWIVDADVLARKR